MMTVVGILLVNEVFYVIFEGFLELHFECLLRLGKTASCKLSLQTILSIGITGLCSNAIVSI